MIFYDTETCGYHGPIVLLQFAVDYGNVSLYCPWKNKIRDTLSIIEKIMEGEVVGFNLAFDHFHMYQMWSVLRLMKNKEAYLEDCIPEYVEKEPEGRYGPCLKPKASFDIMLHARRGPYQSTMDREEIRLKRVPTALAWQLASELEKRIKFKDIYFAKKKSGKRWTIYDIIDRETDRINPDFKDVVLTFAPSSALKALSVDALGIKEVLTFADVELSDKLVPKEYGYAPFAKAVGAGAWPEVISHHIGHWCYNTQARKYATDDVVYLQRLYKFFGCPSVGDDDSELACMSGCVRWRGYAIDPKALFELAVQARIKKTKVIDSDDILYKPVPGVPGKRFFPIPTAPAQTRKYIEEVLDQTSLTVLQNSTKKSILEGLSKWLECPKCFTHYEDEEISCTECNVELVQPEAAIRAAECLGARQADYEIKFYEKLIISGRFHASINVIGALSGRSSGAGSSGAEGGDGDGLNAQGVKRTKDVRSCFPLADGGLILCGGDFDSFEVTLAEAAYCDPELRSTLLIGKSIHGLLGTFLYHPMTYEEIMASKGKKMDYYERSKRAFFAMLYGGEGYTLNDRISIPIEVADKAIEMFRRRYPKVGEHAAKIDEMFCSMRQPGGLGTKVEWHDPHDFIESMLGYRRYFTLENQICKALFTLGNDPPKEWKATNIKVQRRDRMQTAYGAVQSALYACAFAIQAASKRAAQNHVIQSTGAQITKIVQRKIWDIQPAGVHEWLVQPLNIHDELECPLHPSVKDEVKAVVSTTVESFRPKVPLIKMEWKSDLKNWAEK